MLEAYLQDRANHYSVSTLNVHEGWLRRLSERGELTALTAAELAAWRADLTWKPGPSGRLYSEQTANQAVGAIRAFYRWALARGYVRCDPAASLKMRSVKSAPRPPLAASREAARRLLDSPDPYTAAGIRDRALLGLLLETGISYQACARLDLDNLQTDVAVLLSEGRKRQLYSLSDGLVGDLERYLDEARPAVLRDPEALFLNSHGRRLQSGSMRQIVRRHRLRAKL